jgi:ABC-2 type transport system permease protein
MDSRLFHFIKKEFLQLMRDPRMIGVALFAPIFQLLMFGYVASTDIKHVSTVILDEDKSVYSRAYLRSFKNSGYFNFNYYAANPQGLAYFIDSGRAKLGLRIPVDFGKKIVRGETAPVQAVLDGSNASSATTIQGYINQINFRSQDQYLTDRLSRAGFSALNASPLDTEVRVWYNPELKSINYMVPAIFAQVLMLVSMVLTTSSIVKEKEKGTMEMLAVTPLRSYELILGKLIPYALVAFFDMTLVFLIATLWFNIQLKGSVLLLFSLGTLFMATGLGLGVFISTISQTQRQAMMSNVFIMAPSFILSGFIFPIANMPAPIQLLTLILPLRYFLAIVRGLFLKGIGLNYLWPEVWPMGLIGLILLSLSILRFRKKLE